jgi:hypothetical protein
MIDEAAAPGGDDVNALILQALMRKLIETGVLSPDDARAVLLDAATRLDVEGERQTPQAARTMALEELAPAFIGTAKPRAGPAR